MTVAIFTYPEQLHSALLKICAPSTGPGFMTTVPGATSITVDWSRISAANSSEHQLH